MDRNTLIIFYVAVAVAGFIYSACTYHPDRDGIRPGIIEKLLYIIAGLIGIELLNGITKGRKK